MVATLPTSSRTTTRYTGGGKAYAADYIKARRVFTAASMSANAYGGETGRMPHEWAARFVEEMTRARHDHTPVYVILSYGTPIAWEANGVAYVPNVRYSNTTSRHQSAARIGFVEYVEALS